MCNWLGLRVQGAGFSFQGVAGLGGEDCVRSGAVGAELQALWLTAVMDLSPAPPGWGTAAPELGAGWQPSSVSRCRGAECMVHGCGSLQLGLQGCW